MALKLFKCTCISDKDVQKPFNKLRISSHSLNIETGHNAKTKIKWFHFMQL